MAVVAGQQNFDIYLSSTPPKQLRFRILNADQTFKITISVYYFSSNRVDVYKNGRFELPTNGAYDSNGLFKVNDYNTNLDSYMPKIANQSGTNLAVREHRKVYATMAGADYLDFKMTAVLFLKFGVPAITESDFFRPENLVQNFADLFGIDPSRIRRVNIIGESRRKRQTQGIKFIELIIYDNPSVDDSSITPEDLKSEDNLNQLYANITNWYTTGQLQQMASDRLNVTLSSLQVEKPLSDSANEIKKLDKIRIIQDADNCREQSPCLTQPILVVLDESNKTVTGLGSSTNPWKIRAKIVSSTNLNMEIILESEASLGDDGFVQFSELGLSQVANSFRLEFELVAPEAVSNPNVNSVQQKAISCSQAVLDLKHMDDQLIVDTDELFNLTVLIVDKYTQTAVNNISWRNHEWRAAVRVYNLPKSQPTGSLTSSSNLVQIDLETKSVKLIDLFLDAPGMYIVEVTIISIGNEYILNKKSNVILVKSPTQSITLSESEPPILYLKFDQNITQNTDMIEVYKAIIYNSLIAKHDLLLTRAISVYDFNMANLAFSLSSDPSSLVTELNNGFVLVDGINLAEATLDDQSVDVKVLTVVDDSNLDGSIDGTSSNACKLEIKQMMLFFIQNKNTRKYQRIQNILSTCTFARN
ncbi:fibrocystin-L-like [Brachionus plicatilis]|uniref:Fibrocystin-L-like n=1 Tax=Brachionus plicatilis TaxID=10195 RepID=A0A3M7S0G1_BRAPC|nr:fibrocystin-L-like [Brachionus plicatilis]